MNIVLENQVDPAPFFENLLAIINVPLFLLS